MENDDIDKPQNMVMEMWDELPERKKRKKWTP